MNQTRISICNFQTNKQMTEVPNLANYTNEIILEYFIKKKKMNHWRTRDIAVYCVCMSFIYICKIIDYYIRFLFRANRIFHRVLAPKRCNWKSFVKKKKKQKYIYGRETARVRRQTHDYIVHGKTRVRGVFVEIACDEVA